MNLESSTKNSDVSSTCRLEYTDRLVPIRTCPGIVKTIGMNFCFSKNQEATTQEIEDDPRRNVLNPSCRQINSVISINKHNRLISIILKKIDFKTEIQKDHGPAQSGINKTESLITSDVWTGPKSCWSGLDWHGDWMLP